MELRCYNVKEIWHECVKCRIGDDIGIYADKFELRKEDIKSMVSQIKNDHGETYCCECHIRQDGEQWTPYRQIVEMLILMGAKAGVLHFCGSLVDNPLIRFEQYGQK